MDEISSQFDEVSESSEARNVEQQSLEDATLRPAEYVEQNGSFEQSEAIQADMAELSSTISDEVSIPVILPGQEANCNPIPLPGQGSEAADSRDDASSNPIPLPGPNEGVTPVPLPIPGPGETSSLDEASDIPLPLPGEAIPVIENLGEVSNDPIPLPGQNEGVTPVPLPIPEPGEASATPINTPGQAIPIDNGMKEVSNDPVPLPGQGSETANSQQEISQHEDPPPPPDLGTMDPDTILRSDEFQPGKNIPLDNSQYIENLRSVSQELQQVSYDADEGDSQEIQDAAEQLDQLAGKLEELQSTPQPDQGQVDDLSAQAESASLKLQNIMDKESKPITDMSGMMKKVQDTASSIINNIK